MDQDELTARVMRLGSGFVRHLQIVGYKEERMGNGVGSAPHLIFLPVVEFRAADRAVRFKDWRGASAASGLNIQVPVLYSAADPSVAMIERGARDWIPWAPTFVLGVFLSLVAAQGWLARLKARKHA